MFFNKQNLEKAISQSHLYKMIMICLFLFFFSMRTHRWPMVMGVIFLAERLFFWSLSQLIGRLILSFFCFFFFLISFLDASSHLYKRVCPSIGPSVGPSVGWLVTLSLFGLLGATNGRVSGLILILLPLFLFFCPSPTTVCPLVNFLQKE